MNNKFKFQELKVYQYSLNFVDSIYKITMAWPKSETFGLVDQVKKASVSIALNIAEGSSRSKKDFVRFLSLSKGSCYECVAILEIALRNKYIEVKVFDSFLSDLDTISRMISGLKKSLIS